MTEQLDLFDHDGRQAHAADLALKRGEKHKSDGMQAAATAPKNNAPDKVRQGRIRFLEALLRSDDGIATVEDGDDDLNDELADGGKWRGSIPSPLARAGIIKRRSYRKSRRPSRHATPVSVWQLIDRDAAIAELQRLEND